MGSPKAENLLKFELGLSMELMKRWGKKPLHLQRITDVSILRKEPSLSTIKVNGICSLQSEIKLGLNSTWAVSKNPYREAYILLGRRKLTQTSST